MKNDKYWIEKAEQNILRAEELSDKQIKKLEKLWASVKYEIEEAVTRFYNINGGDNGLSSILEVMDKDSNKSYNGKAKKYYKEAKEKKWQEVYQSKVLSESVKKKVKRIEDLKLVLYHIIQNIYENEQIILTEGLSELYKESYTKSMYDMQVGLEIGIKFDAPNEETIKRIIQTNWLDSNYSARIWKDKVKLVTILEQELLRGFALGENPRKIANRVSQKMEVSKHNAERLVRTEFSHIANEASFNTVQELDKALGGGVFTKYKFLATLDSRTSLICQELDLEEFYFKDRVERVNFPPMHPNCRSTYKLVLKRGIIGERIAKRLDTGEVEYVPDNIPYKEWAKKFEKVLDKNKK